MAGRCSILGLAVLFTASSFAFPSTGTPVLGGSAAHSAPSPSDDLFEARAAAFLERVGLDPAVASEMTLEEARDQALTRIDLGLFDMRFPPDALKDGASCQHLSELARALLTAQATWLEWLPSDAKVPSAAKGQWKTLERWIKGWKPQSFPDAGELRGKELIALLEPKKKVIEAASALRELMRDGELFGRAEEELSAAELILLPTRADFVEFNALTGLLANRHRGPFWVPDVVRWTEFDFDGVRAMALQFATPEAERDYRSGLSMTGKNPRAMAEQVVQIAARSLFERTLGDGIEPAFAAGLANNLVIDLYGEVDTRTDGDLRQRVTAERSVFIPGGNPNGGVLPPNAADSRWRETMGKDHFVGALRKAQIAGESRGDKLDKIGSFELRGDRGEAHVVRAPFLGPRDDAQSAAPPQTFAGDHAEFLRAYRCAFLYWLREKTEGRRSAERFGTFLHQTAAAGDESDLAQLLMETYGSPLSAPDPEALFDGTLEGSFLEWLAKQR